MANPRKLYILLLIPFLINCQRDRDKEVYNKQEYLEWFKEHRYSELSSVKEYENVKYTLSYYPNALNKLDQYKNYNFKIKLNLQEGHPLYSRYPFSNQDWMEFGLKPTHKYNFMLKDKKKTYRPKDVFFEYNQVNTNELTINLYFEISEKRQNHWKLLFDETFIAKQLIDFNLEINNLPKLAV